MLGLRLPEWPRLFAGTISSEAGRDGGYQHFFAKAPVNSVSEPPLQQAAALVMIGPIPLLSMQIRYCTYFVRQLPLFTSTINYSKSFSITPWDMASSEGLDVWNSL